MTGNPMFDAFISRRGYDHDFLKKLSVCCDELMLNEEGMADELHHIHDSMRRIVILPDFDMDGICAGTVLFAGLCELGFNVSLFRPDSKDGYGFTPAVIDRLMAQFPDAAALLTCDTGVTCFEGVKRAKEYGLKVLITDHHRSEDVLPAADIIVDPMQNDDTYPDGGICGAAVAWKVLMTYTKKYIPIQQHEQIKRLKVFAGIGTISDSMPMVHENRDYVKMVITFCQLLRQECFQNSLRGSLQYQRAFHGLSLVINMLEKQNKIRRDGDINEELFGFYVAPMFNSVKRMDGDIEEAFNVFFGNCPNASLEILCDLNEKRKETVSGYMEKLQKSEQPLAPYIWITDAPAGIKGLLATKMMEITGGMPTLVLGFNDDGSLSGSGRSPQQIAALDLLKSSGFEANGHQNAFGFHLENAEYLADLYTLLNDAVSDALQAGLFDVEYVPDVTLSTFDSNADVRVDIFMIRDYMDKIARLAPFGPGFEKPTQRMTFRRSDVSFQALGKEGQHVKMHFVNGLDVICWNQPELLKAENENSVIQVDGDFSINEFRGRSTVQFCGAAQVLQ